MRSSHAHAPAFVDPRAREEGELAEDAEGAVAVEACVDAVTGCRGLLAMLGQGGAAKRRGPGTGPGSHGRGRRAGVAKPGS